MKRLIACSLMAIITIPALDARQLQTPTDWLWRNDTPAKVVSTGPPPADGWFFVAMPPGWHVTTGPGTLIYHPGHTAKGAFALEMEVHLFPGDSQSEYGIFAGGRALETASTAPEYVAFVARRDGKSAILRHTGKSTTAVREWTASPAVAPHPGGEDTVKNILRLDATAQEVTFSANGKEIVKMPRAGLTIDGLFGLRIGANLTVHVTRLDATHKLAPGK